MKTLQISDETYEMLRRRTAAYNLGSIEEYLSVLATPGIQREQRTTFSWETIEKEISDRFHPVPSAKERWIWFVDLIARLAPNQIKLAVDYRPERDTDPLLIDYHESQLSDDRYSRLPSGTYAVLTEFESLEALHQAVEALATAVGCWARIASSVKSKIRKGDWKRDVEANMYDV